MLRFGVMVLWCVCSPVGPVNPWEVGVRRNQINDVFAAKALLEALSKHVMHRIHGQ